MGKTFTYKEITYELKEKQGFFFCLVYGERQEQTLYQTKYYGTAGRARSAAMVFIEDYHAFQEKQREKNEEQRPKSKPERSKAKPNQEKEVTRPPAPKPQDDKSRVKSSQLTHEDPKTDRAMQIGRMRATPTSKPQREIKSTQRLKSQDSQQDRRGGVFTTLSLVVVFTLIGTLVVYSYSQYLESESRKNQMIPTIPSTDSSSLGIPLPSVRETIDLSHDSQPQTPTQTATPTTTTTLTPTSTNPSTQSPVPATNTPKPTDPPSATITPTPSPTDTPTNTASPTNTFTPTATISATQTPTPTTIPPSATITSTPTP
jgi:hypothetical protein